MDTFQEHKLVFQLNVLVILLVRLLAETMDNGTMMHVLDTLRRVYHVTTI